MIDLLKNPQKDLPKINCIYAIVDILCYLRISILVSKWFWLAGFVIDFKDIDTN